MDSTDVGSNIARDKCSGGDCGSYSGYGGFRGCDDYGSEGEWHGTDILNGIEDGSRKYPTRESRLLPADLFVGLFDGAL